MGTDRNHCVTGTYLAAQQTGYAQPTCHSCQPYGHTPALFGSLHNVMDASPESSDPCESAKLSYSFSLQTQEMETRDNPHQPPLFYRKPLDERLVWKKAGLASRGNYPSTPSMPAPEFLPGLSFAHVCFLPPSSTLFLFAKLHSTRILALTAPPSTVPPLSI